MKYYTYAYLREDGTPYYIGKGKNGRMHSDHKKIPLPPKERRIYLKKNLTEEQSFKHEIYMIGVFGRKDLKTGILLNMTDGGEGVSGGIAPNRKSINLFGKEYLSIKAACVDNDISYQQYMIMINDNISVNNGEELKKIIWKRRSHRISKGQKGNKNKTGWKSNPSTYIKQSISIKKALAKKRFNSGMG